MADARARATVRRSPGRRPRVSKVGSAREALSGFGRGLELYCLTYGQFSLMDAVEALLEVTGPADVAISTWTAATADLSRSAEHLRNDRIRSLRFVVDTSFPQRQPGYAARLVELFGEDAIRTTRTHAKFVTLSNDSWNCAIRTSMNLNENPRLECIEVSDDPVLCGFLLAVVDEIFAAELPGDYRTKRVPELRGIAALAPSHLVSMSRAGVRLGP